LKRANYILILCSLILLSCKDDVTSSGNNQYQYKEDLGANTNDGHDLHNLITTSSIKHKKIDGIDFSVNGINAVDYIKRVGQNNIAEEDLDELKQETVFIVEFTDENEFKNIFDSEKILLDKDKAVQYLIGDLQNDFKVKQEGAIVSVNGLNYEGQVGTQNKIRVVFYAKGVDLNKPYTVEYYDRLFGKGLIKFKRTVNEIIS